MTMREQYICLHVKYYFQAFYNFTFSDALVTVARLKVASALDTFKSNAPVYKHKLNYFKVHNYVNLKKFHLSGQIKK